MICLIYFKILYYDLMNFEESIPNEVRFYNKIFQIIMEVRHLNLDILTSCYTYFSVIKPLYERNSYSNTNKNTNKILEINLPHFTF